MQTQAKPSHLLIKNLLRSFTDHQKSSKKQMMKVNKSTCIHSSNSIELPVEPILQSSRDLYRMHKKELWQVEDTDKIKIKAGAKATLVDIVRTLEVSE